MIVMNWTFVSSGRRAMVSTALATWLTSISGSTPTLPFARGPRGRSAGEPLMDVRHVADAVLTMARLPLDTNVQFMTIMATKMPFVGRG